MTPPPLSKARAKLIRSLQAAKHRQAQQQFVVEGAKSVLELLASDFHTDLLVATADFLGQNHETLVRFTGETLEAPAELLASLGNLETNDTALAIARMKPNDPVTIPPDEWALVLDDIRDPGNLGTILRIADWYDITTIIASPDTVDRYNPKVLQASMGSFTRVTVYYTDLPPLLSACTTPVFGAFLDGENIHQVNFGPGGLIVIGNEAHGISAPVQSHITRRITIPRFGRAESLNAAVATAVICDTLRNRPPAGRKSP